MVVPRIRLSQAEYEMVMSSREGLRTLVIGDLHEPFTRYGYRNFCKEIYNKYKCNNVVFIGDILDNHYSSYHESDPDGHSARQELELAKGNIKKWYDDFPNAYVTLGNHDIIPNRKAMTSGVSAAWIKPINEVLDVPSWTFDESFTFDGVLFVHGTGRKARQRAKQDMISVVQGHYHSESYIEWYVGKRDKIFAMQVGCGMYDKAYAAAYGRHFAKMHINVGVIVNGVPILEYMDI